LNFAVGAVGGVKEVMYHPVDSLNNWQIYRDDYFAESAFLSFISSAGEM
jgi:hypothetical protein